MFRKTLLLMTTILVSWTCGVQAGVVNSEWTGGRGGEWANAANWSPATVPDNTASQTFAVTIDGSEGKTQVRISQNRTVNQLDVYGNVWLENRTPNNIELVLVGENGLTNYGNLRLRGGAFNELGQFTIDGNVTNEPNAMLELLGVHIWNDFYNSSEAAVLIKYENCFVSGVQNNGAIIVDLFGEMGTDANIVNTGQIQICGGMCAAVGLLHNDANAIIEGFGMVHSNESFQNSGTIFASSGSLVLHTDASFVNAGTLENRVGAVLSVMARNADVNNSDKINVNASGSVVFDCNLVNEPNGVIELLGGTLAAQKVAQSPGATFEGFGGITGNVVIDPNGIMKLTGPTNIVGTVQIAENATLEIIDGTTLITGHTICNGTIHMRGGRIIPQDGLSGDCNIIWEPGAYTNGADFNLDGRVDFEDFTDFADTWLWQADWYTP